ncbi:pyridoxamine 5'-phosphate oxidase-domain-containing protein [Aspergillus pseudonomiae]|uniref:Pyridoxamine 5'-phosphate oxidase-domain-containing protein n=1 Tax=Aspergillus pseudonomiae TaxID=1506151 RepID=A0A5N6I1C6_9EURO|nr:pyridoxamine 5'-phosphate oxidase-domain-containing protein [Aspergillus pseudonomiae]KAB8260531.1 pyridoxamine 5'-phosphate oxidase-domain-containing protein [Aspergillus pseudonomiae]KAE8397159.1 pyridoxamine 5'-phosphate oxidase-domain-containing protein [Aspergillus pseudonomiae]
MKGLDRGLALVSTLALLFLQAVAVPLSAAENASPDQAVLGDTYSFPSTSENNVDVFDKDPEAAAAPSWFTSTLMARRLLALSTTGVASTIFSHNPKDVHVPAAVAGLSISQKEYVSDCDEALPPTSGNGGNGDPTFLALEVETTFRNTAAGSNISITLDWWDHLNETEPLWPGFPLSPAGLPRVTLFGYVEPFPNPAPEDTEAALRSCYLKAHPDARVWLPERPGSPHRSHWVRMVVTHVYWIGGFGGFQRIGWMNVTEWKGIRREESLPGIGDGRGWEDVRLPGEKGY